MLEPAEDAIAAYVAARDLYPPGEPYQGVAAARVVAHHLTTGNAPAASEAWAWFASWQGRTEGAPNPSDTALLARLRVERTLLEADLETMHGRHRDAAWLVQSLAADRTIDVDLEGRSGWWERAARSWSRAGDLDPAIEAAEEAGATTADAGRAANLALWQLFARFDGLDEHADPSALRSWPGDAFVDAAIVHVRAWAHESHAATHALTLASAALRIDRPNEALRIYEIALENIHLARLAAEDDDVFEGLLVAVDAAIRIGATNRARDLLGRLERVRARRADDPADATIRALRIAIGRTERDAAPRREAPPPALGPRIAPADVGSAVSQGDRATPAAPRTARRRATPGAGAAVGLALVVVAILVVRRTRRPTGFGGPDR